jgi:hypothetical protein
MSGEGRANSDKERNMADLMDKDTFQKILDWLNAHCPDLRCPACAASRSGGKRPWQRL